MKPTSREMEAWLRDVDLLKLSMQNLRRDHPWEVVEFMRDVRMIAQGCARVDGYTAYRPAIYRMIKRLGFAIMPSATPQQARKIGRSVLPKLKFLRDVFEVKVRREWVNKVCKKIEEYDEICLEMGFVERTRQLSQPGAISDQIELHRKELLPAPARISRAEARKQAAIEAAEYAKKLYGDVPRKWFPLVSDRELQRRYAEYFEKHSKQGYWGSVSNSPLFMPSISIDALTRKSGRPSGT